MNVITPPHPTPPNQSPNPAQCVCLQANMNVITPPHPHSTQPKPEPSSVRVSASEHERYHPTPPHPTPPHVHGGCGFSNENACVCEPTFACVCESKTPVCVSQLSPGMSLRHPKTMWLPQWCLLLCLCFGQDEDEGSGTIKGCSGLGIDWRSPRTMAEGILLYPDKDYTFQNVPPVLFGGTYIGSHCWPKAGTWTIEYQAPAKLYVWAAQGQFNAESMMHLVPMVGQQNLQKTYVVAPSP